MSTDLPRRAFLTVSAAGLVGLLTGCITPRPPITYDLRPFSGSAVSRRTMRMLVVAEPRAIQTYDTERVVVREAGGVLSYLPEAQWSDRLPPLIQTRLLQSFQDSQFPNVGIPSDQLDPQIALILEVRAFELDVGTGNAVVTLSARLLDDWNRSIVATRTFTAATPLTALQPSIAIPALEAALQNVIAQIVTWAAANA